jgi:protein-S-isoprenylcysteine O-methyltransferase Ste14
MDPINIIAGINIIATFGANFSGAKKGLKTSVSNYKERPKTWLQTVPATLATITLLFLILGIFKIGTIDYAPQYDKIRLYALIIYLASSWFQISAFKTLGDNYAQDIVVLKNHSLVQKGIYKYIRHPHYLAQIIIDLSAAAAVLSYLILPLAVIQIPILIMRALAEEKLLQKHFGEAFTEYKKKTGFMIPFVG